MKKQTLLSLLAVGAASTAMAQTPIDPTGFPGEVFIPNPFTPQVLEIQSDITLTAGATLADSTYILQGLTFVNPGVTITIEEGVVVRGQPRDGTSIPGILCVSRGGEIIADGTQTNPIIFTTAESPDGSRWIAGDAFKDADPKGAPMAPDVNRWGALVLLGYAPTNAGTVDTGIAGEAYIEGLVIEDERTTYGGMIPNDSSGILDYVSLRYTGDAITDGDEIQGLTLGGTGYGTQITNLEVYGSGDDGIEIFGGTSTLKNFVISYVDDDGLDMDQGYTGLLQFGFVLASGLTGITTDNTAEWDGDDCCDSDDQNNFNIVAQPTTHPTLYNLTFWGATLASGNEIETISHALRFRRGFGGQLNNSIVANYANQSGLFEINNDSAEAAPVFGFPSQDPFDQLEAGTLGVAGTIFFNMGDNTAAGIGQSAETTAIINNSAAYPACDLNRVGAPGSAADPGYGVFGTAGTYDQTIQNGLNPAISPAGAAVDTDFLVPYTSLFFDEVEYAGAFAPDTLIPLWTTGWTALNTSGVLVDSPVGNL